MISGFCWADSAAGDPVCVLQRSWGGAGAVRVLVRCAPRRGAHRWGLRACAGAGFVVMLDCAGSRSAASFVAALSGLRARMY